MKSYKVGDRVRIRKDLELGKEYGELDCLLPHVGVSGRSAIIREVTDHGNYRIDISNFIFSQEMIEGYDNKIKIIDILNMIAKGAEPPKKIKYKARIYEYKVCDYFDDENDFLSDTLTLDDEDLNEEVEIIVCNEIKLKLKEHIDLYELRQNHWNGCQGETMEFLLENYSYNEYFTIKKEDKREGAYRIHGLTVNEKCFEKIID